MKKSGPIIGFILGLIIDILILVSISTDELGLGIFLLFFLPFITAFLGGIVSVVREKFGKPAAILITVILLIAFIFYSIR